MDCVGRAMSNAMRKPGPTALAKYSAAALWQ
jgi:hypothetical protein